MKNPCVGVVPLATRRLVGPLLLSLAAAGALAAWPRAALAAPEALQVLLGGVGSGMAGLPPAGSAGGGAGAGAGAAGGDLAPSARQQLTVRPGETLQTIVRRTLRGTPYNDAFLREAFMQLNPGAFAGSVHRLRAGAVLQVPTAHDLRQLADGGQPGQAGSLAGAPAHARAPEDRKQWVRFP